MTHQDNTKIIDPFLLQILKQRREDNKISDILRSIQEEQNSIVDYDFEANMIVQGCAGSGKTMILFHRLANILYNIKSFSRPISPNRIAIIIPNDSFNDYVNDLSQSLSIGYIKTLTLDDYILSKVEDSIKKIFKSEEGDGFGGCSRKRKDDAIGIFLEEVRMCLIKRVKHSTKKARFNVEDRKDLVNFINTYQKKLRSMRIQRDREHEIRIRDVNINREEHNKWLKTSLTGIRSYRKKSMDEFRERFLLKDCDRGYLIGFLMTICSNSTLSDYRPYSEQILLIDEGQDYGKEEYLMLKKANPECIFNVYGDIEQKIFERGLTSWKRVVRIFDASFFELRQNYRNSMQIVDYVNKSLNKKMISIGFSAKDVELVEKSKLYIYLEYEHELLKNNIAIVSEFPDNYAAYSNVAKILSVEQIKGLEFNTVFISPEILNMHKNFQYVAMTRALSHLYILSLDR